MRLYSVFIGILLPFLWSNTLFSASSSSFKTQEEIKKYLIISRSDSHIERKYEEGSKLSIWLKSRPDQPIKGKLLIYDKHTIMVNDHAIILSDISRIDIQKKSNAIARIVLFLFAPIAMIAGYALAFTNIADGYFGLGVMAVGLFSFILALLSWPLSYHTGRKWHLSTRSEKRVKKMKI